MNATEIAIGASSDKFLFDIPSDEDWFQFSVFQGESYSIAVNNLTGGATPTIEVYTGHLDSVASNDGSSTTLTFISSDPGQHYIRVLPASGSPTGCDVGYTVAVSLQ